MGQHILSRLRAAVDAYRFADGSKGAQEDRPLASTADEYYSGGYLGEGFAIESVDEVVLRKGLGVYREMEESDDMVASSIGMLKYARLSTQTEIRADSDDPEAAKVAEFVREALYERLSGGGLPRFLHNTLDALGMGFVTIEKVYAPPDVSGEWRGKQFLHRLIPLPQETITFGMDDHGDIANDGVWQAKAPLITASRAPVYFNKMPRDRFVIWSWRSRWGNPLGVSILKPAYKPYFAKGKMVDWYARYMERFGMPWVWAKTKPGAKANDRASLVRKLRDFVGHQAMAVPNDGELNIEWPSSGAAAQFLDAIKYYDRSIARAMLEPETLLELGATGSLALGVAQKSTFEWPLDSLGVSLSTEVMQDQIIKPLVLLNFGEGAPCPKFFFKDYNEPDLVKIATALKIMYDMGLPIPLPYIREVTGVPEVADGDDALQSSGKPEPPPFGKPEPDAEDEGADAEEAAFNGMIREMFETQLEHNGKNGRFKDAAYRLAGRS